MTVQTYMWCVIRRVPWVVEVPNVNEEADEGQGELHKAEHHCQD